MPKALPSQPHIDWLKKTAKEQLAALRTRDASAKLNSNQTTAGKMFSDPQLYDNLSGLTGDLRLLVGEFRKDPKKFLRVSFSIF